MEDCIAKKNPEVDHRLEEGSTLIPLTDLYDSMTRTTKWWCMGG